MIFLKFPKVRGVYVVIIFFLRFLKGLESLDPCYNLLIR